MAKDKQQKKPEPAEITDEVLAEVIDLARLDPLSPGISIQKVHLRKILDYFKMLDQIDIEGLDPAIQINNTPIPLRDDAVTESLTIDEAMSNARLRTDEFFLAPKILGGDDTDTG